MLKLTGKADKVKYTPEELTSISLDEIKKMIEIQEPGAFDKKKPVKKAATKKAAPKKAVAKK
jgi:DNA topoisomerase-1